MWKWRLIDNYFTWKQISKYITIEKLFLNCYISQYYYSKNTISALVSTKCLQKHQRKKKAPTFELQYIYKICLFYSIIFPLFHCVVHHSMKITDPDSFTHYKLHNLNSCWATHGLTQNAENGFLVLITGACWEQFLDFFLLSKEQRNPFSLTINRQNKNKTLVWAYPFFCKLTLVIIIVINTWHCPQPSCPICMPSWPEQPMIWPLQEPE